MKTLLAGTCGETRVHHKKKKKRLAAIFKHFIP